MRSSTGATLASRRQAWRGSEGREDGTTRRRKTKKDDWVDGRRRGDYGWRRRMVGRGRALHGGLSARRGGVDAIDETTRRVRITFLECAFGILVQVRKEARTSCFCDGGSLRREMDGSGSDIEPWT